MPYKYIFHLYIYIYTYSICIYIYTIYIYRNDLTIWSTWLTNRYGFILNLHAQLARPCTTSRPAGGEGDVMGFSPKKW